MIKQLKLDLQKIIIIVEPPKGYTLLHYKGGNSRLGFVNTGIANPYDDVLDLSVNGNLKLICKGDELNEEILENIIFRSKIGNYKDYNYKEGTLQNGLLDALRQMSMKTPLESFISAVESKGFWWGEKESIFSICPRSSGMELYENKAKSKTFNPKTTYIFEYETRVV